MAAWLAMDTIQADTVQCCDDVLASDFNEEELKFVSELPESKSIRELKHVFLKIAQARGQTWDLLGFCLFSRFEAVPKTTGVLRLLINTCVYLI